MPSQKMKIGSAQAVTTAVDRVMYMARRASPKPRRMKEQQMAPAMST